ncbi:hypothetical protein FM103_07405 [Corynebacterium xerosis]|nr:hypothetical protein FM103_07405 [Corynebacterium xerosis]
MEGVSGHRGIGSVHHEGTGAPAVAGAGGRTSRLGPHSLRSPGSCRRERPP